MKLMKIHNLSVAFIFVVASCSSPKHFTDFNNYSFQIAKKKTAIATPEAEPVVRMNAAQLTASTVSTPALFSREIKSKTTTNHSASFSRNEKKELKREVKSEVKRIVSEIKKLELNSTQAVQGWDKDLKMAAIFGAIGIVLGSLVGVSEIIAFAGAVAIVIALVFLIKWLVRQ